MRDKSNRVLQYWVGSVAQLLGNDKVAICKFTSVTHRIGSARLFLRTLHGRYVSLRFKIYLAYVSLRFKIYLAYMYDDLT